MAKQASGFLVEDSRFWVVRPRIAGGQASGLGTLFSGSYIGMDIGTSTSSQSDFVGLEMAPIVTGDQAGRQFILRGPQLGSHDVGSPVYYRQVPVGRVLANELDKDGAGVTLKIFVEAPHDKYVYPNTRFWNASGIDFTADANGVRIQTQSLVSILLGGIAFETPKSSEVEQPAEENTGFALFEDRTEAMKRPDLEVVPFTMYFSGSLRGLLVGAAVDFSGVTIGEVKSIHAEYDPAINAMRMPVEVALYPERLRSLSLKTMEKPSPEQKKARFDGWVDAGLRAVVKTGSLLTGQLYVALDFFPDAPKAKVDWSKTPPVLPTVPGGLQELQLMVANIAKNIEKLPLDKISADLRVALQSFSRTLQSSDVMVNRLNKEVTPAARDALQESRGMIHAAERTLAQDAPLPQDLRDALRELNRASQSLRLLGDYLERHPEAIFRGKKRD
jgi:paraquat-inducible protein B